MLLKAGANANLVDDKNRTALHLSAKKGNANFRRLACQLQSIQQIDQFSFHRQQEDYESIASTWSNRRRARSKRTHATAVGC